MDNALDPSTAKLREDIENELKECLKSYAGETNEKDILKAIKIAIKRILLNKLSELSVDIPIELVKVSTVHDDISVDFTDLMTWFKWRKIC